MNGENNWLIVNDRFVAWSPDKLPYELANAEALQNAQYKRQTNKFINQVDENIKNAGRFITSEFFAGTFGTAPSVDPVIPSIEILADGKLFGQRFRDAAYEIAKETAKKITGNK